MIESRPGGQHRIFEDGDRVIARSYRGGEKWVAGTIHQKTGPLSYKVQINGGFIRRHVDQIKRDHRKETMPESVEVEAYVPTPESTTVAVPSSPTPNESTQELDTTPERDDEPAVALPEVEMDSSTETSSQQPPLRLLPLRKRNQPKHLEDYSR